MYDDSRCMTAHPYTIPYSIKLRHFLYEHFLSTPGNVLLPPMGFCEIHESSKDSKQSVTNSNKFVCEISPNILYQYVLILLWFLIVFSIIVSISGFLVNLIGHIVTVTCFLRHDNPAREIYQVIIWPNIRIYSPTLFLPHLLGF